MLIPEKGVHQTSERYFFTPSSLARELFYYPTRGGHYFCSSLYSFDHRSEIAIQGDHNQNIMLFYIHSGAMELTLGGVRALAAAGQVVLFDCREPYRYAASDGLEFSWLLFNGLNTRAFYRRILQAHGGRQVFMPSGVSEIAQLLDSIFTGCAADERPGEAQLSQMLHRMLGLLLLDDTSPAHAGSDRIAEAIRYMNRHLFEELSVQEVAASVSLSSSHFSRQFKAKTGYSPYEYIILRRIDKAKKAAKGDKKYLREVEVFSALKDWLNDGNSARSFDCDEDDAAIIAAAELLSLKPIIYAANLDEEGFADCHANAYYKVVEELAAKEGAQVIPVCAKLEAEIAELDGEEKKMFLDDLGIAESGLDRLIKASYALLGLISFLTSGEDECRAWTIKRGTKAPQAAGKIHSDFERGFIRAEVVSYDDLMACGTMAAAREKGLIRSEGKEYVVQDGDIILFRFNV